jgi:hypothetical protein
VRASLEWITIRKYALTRTQREVKHSRIKQQRADAAEIEWINIEAIRDKNFGFDHKHILVDYNRWKKSGGTFWSSKFKP